MKSLDQYNLYSKIMQLENERSIYSKKEFLSQSQYLYDIINAIKAK